MMNYKLDDVARQDEHNSYEYARYILFCHELLLRSAAITRHAGMVPQKACTLKLLERWTIPRVMQEKDCWPAHHCSFFLMTCASIASKSCQIRKFCAAGQISFVMHKWAA